MSAQGLHWFVIPLCLLISVLSVTSLQCFQCSSSAPGSKCETGVKEFAKYNHSKFAQNCSDFNFKGKVFCAIETEYINISTSNGLSCYSCEGTKPFSKCESDIREYRLGINSKFAVNCSKYSHMKKPYCAIERYMKNGETFSIIRDCNQEQFSFNTRLNKYKIFQYLNPSKNTTLCTISGWSLICVTLCDTDMCNAPSKGHQPTSVTGLWFLTIPLSASISWFF
ncbi:uncharacterized protein LOC106879162 isoform X2 [Octopus bimaculoides]|uniref:uncharacterized protein LOC106879162 isoform X2 n=1 Tax=Octopus bimaculoides TaxID=37653 RepID=UPI00071C8A4A|nr:uncharacterized protein LOC106879162 isoform X2 [Octopus bimaculoides]|eukprot:XP_014784093.1 PREDICTED: uncharacterized protein LOC106879162 [Octopus bimaculoides]